MFRPPVSGDGTGIDYAIALFKMVKSRLGDVEIGEYVRFEGLAQIFRCDFGNVLRWKLHGRIVDHNINSSEFIYGPFYRRFAKVFVPDVALNQKTIASLILDSLFGGLCILFFLQVNYGNIGSFPGKMYGGTFADTTVPPVIKAILSFNLSLPPVIFPNRFRIRVHLMLIPGLAFLFFIAFDLYVLIHDLIF